MPNRARAALREYSAGLGPMAGAKVPERIDVTHGAAMKAIVDKMMQDGVLDASGAGDASMRMKAGASVEEAILAVGVAEAELHACLAEMLGLARAALPSAAPSADFLARFPARVLLTYRLLPLDIDGDTVRVATSRPLAAAGLDELQMITGLTPRPVLAGAAEIEACLDRLLGVGADTMEVLVGEAHGRDESAEGVGDVELEATAEDASIITFVNQILAEAIERRATDVHIEPFEQSLRVRYRVDGVLQETPIPREVRRFHAAIVSRLKILAQLDIAEKRVPQDGRVKLRIGAREVDVRVSVIPMLHGEAVVLRLLDRSAALLGLEHLGMSQRDRAIVGRALALPHGVVLVTGPTGSGKTTSLYACLSMINDIERKIVTIEDPVEYHLEGINQIQVATKSGMTFARGLRATLRHDPDVVLIGEIRDGETAEIAVQASLTGHLVFSTLHTNDAPSAAMRLVDMGVEPYLIASSLEAVMAQRLVRTICPHCRTAYTPEDVSLLQKRFGDELPTEFYNGSGCEQCHGSGYLGRAGIFEIMPVSERIRQMILDRASASDLRRQAIAEGMRTLRQDGWRVVRAGQTTPDEVLRLTKDEFDGEGGD